MSIFGSIIISYGQVEQTIERNDTDNRTTKLCHVLIVIDYNSGKIELLKEETSDHLNNGSKAKSYMTRYFKTSKDEKNY